MFPVLLSPPHKTLRIKFQDFEKVITSEPKVNSPPSRVGESTSCNHPSHHIERDSVIDDGVERVCFAVNGVVAGLT